MQAALKSASSALAVGAGCAALEHAASVALQQCADLSVWCVLAGPIPMPRPCSTAPWALRAPRRARGLGPPSPSRAASGPSASERGAPPRPGARAALLSARIFSLWQCPRDSASKRDQRIRCKVQRRRVLHAQFLSHFFCFHFMHPLYDDTIPLHFISFDQFAFTHVGRRLRASRCPSNWRRNAEAQRQVGCT